MLYDKNKGKILRNIFELKEAFPHVIFPITMPTHGIKALDLIPVVAKNNFENNFDTVRYEIVEQPVEIQVQEDGSEIAILPRVLKEVTSEVYADKQARYLTGNAIAIREQRDDLLDQTDWTQLPDSPVDKAVWAVYRQALRDVTAQESFPQSVVWPTAPAL